MKKSIKAIIASGAMVVAAFGFSSVINVNDVVCSNVEALTSGDNVTLESQYAFKRKATNSYCFVRTGSSTTSSLCGCDYVDMFEDDGECLEITVWGKRN